MNQYTIYCSAEQTQKAYKLGAPIAKMTEEFNAVPSCYVDKSNNLFEIPTSEQMISWLEDGLLEEVHIEQDIDSMWSYTIYGNGNDLFGISNLYPSRKEATIAAIDAALEYLTNNKK